MESFFGGGSCPPEADSPDNRLLFGADDEVLRTLLSDVEDGGRSRSEFACMTTGLRGVLGDLAFCEIAENSPVDFGILIFKCGRLPVLLRNRFTGSANSGAILLAPSTETACVEVALEL